MVGAGIRHAHRVARPGMQEVVEVVAVFEALYSRL
jgi:hypothetical protein